MIKHLIVTLIALSTFRIESYSQAANRETVLLESLGAFSALTLYNTYIVIGSVADSYSSQLYDKDMAASLTKEQITSIGTLIETCNNLMKPGILIDQSDKDFILGIKESFELLKSQAGALSLYIDSGDATDETAFQDRRKAAWKKISTLLGLDK